MICSRRWKLKFKHLSATIRLRGTPLADPLFLETLKEQSQLLAGVQNSDSRISLELPPDPSLNGGL